MVPSDDIKEDISEEEDKVDLTLKAPSSPTKMGQSLKGNKVDRSFEESEDVDGLIKWAKNLPDDIGNSSHTSQFFMRAT